MAAPLPVSRRQRWDDFRRGPLTVIVWAVAALVAATMLVARSREGTVLGLAEAPRYPVSPAVTGTVAAVLVEAQQHVDAGTPLARLDDAPVAARLATAGQTVAKLTADLAAARSRATSTGGPAGEGYSFDARRFEYDAEQRRLEAMALSVTLESDRVELARLTLAHDRARQLAAQGVIGTASLDDARLAREALAAKVERTERLLEVTEREQRAAEQRRAAFEAGRAPGAPLDPLLAPLAEAIRVQQARVDELKLERSMLTLRAPAAGVVSEIACREGQAATPGMPVVVVTAVEVAEIVAYLPESAVRTLAPRQKVSLAPRTDPRRRAESAVLRVGAALAPLPQQLWRDPRIAEFGLPVTIAAVPALALVPGEVVLVGRAR